MNLRILTMVCGFYATFFLSGCSIVMALHGNKEPDFEHIRIGDTKEALDFEFDQPGTSKDLGDGKTEVTYKYEKGNSPNPGRAGVVLSAIEWKPNPPPAFRPTKRRVIPPSSIIAPAKRPPSFS